MFSYSTEINPSKTETADLIDFNSQTVVNDMRSSDTDPIGFESLKYGEPPLPLKNEFYTTPDIRRIFIEAKHPSPKQTMWSRVVSTGNYDAVAEFHHSEDISKSENTSARGVKQSSAPTNTPEVFGQTTKESETNGTSGDAVNSTDHRLNIMNEPEIGNNATHDASCVDIFCPGGRKCFDRHDEIVQAKSFIEQMQFSQKRDKLALKLGNKARMDFSMDDIKRETHAIHALHHLLRCEGSSSVQHMFDVLADYAELTDKPVVFLTSKELEDFVNRRTFFFDVRSHSNLIRNRGNGYREGIHTIAIWVKELSFCGGTCKVSDLWEKILKHLLPYDSRDTSAFNDTWFTLHQISSIADFVMYLKLNHSDLFVFSGNDVHQTIEMSPAAYKIPSLWMSACFNERPRGSYFDRSRVENFYIKIDKTDFSTAEGHVVYGQFSGRTVELSSKNFGWTNMMLLAPVGETIYVQAYYVFSDKKDFIAESIYSPKSCLESFSRRCIPTVEEVVSNNQSDELVFETFEPNDSLTSLSADQLQRLQRELESEKKKIDFATQFIKNQILSEEDCTNMFTQDQNNPFSTADQFLSFIRTRSHLFQYDEGQISRVHHRERVIFRQLIDFLSTFYEGLVYENIEKSVISGEAGEVLANCTNISYLNRYVYSLKPMLSYEDNLNETLEHFCLKGTYLPGQRILLPFYCIDGIRRVNF